MIVTDKILTFVIKMPRIKPGDPNRRMRKSSTPQTDEATDVTKFGECIIYLADEEHFDIAPLLGDGREHGILTLLRKEGIPHLTLRKRLKPYLFQPRNTAPKQRLYLFALIRYSKNEQYFNRKFETGK